MERDGGGNGRVHTIALHAQDASGNRTATSVQVMLPHDILAAAIDDGPRYKVVSACPSAISRPGSRGPAGRPW
jgi:hypothetical protein